MRHVDFQHQYVVINIELCNAKRNHKVYALMFFLYPEVYLSLNCSLNLANRIHRRRRRTTMTKLIIDGR